MPRAEFDLASPRDVFPSDSKLVMLGEAILSDDAALIRALVDQHPEILSATGEEQVSPLMFATINLRALAVKTLVEIGADPFQQTSGRLNLGCPIALALRATKGPDLLHAMLAAGVSIEGGLDGESEPLLFTAVFQPGTKRLMQLIAAGANLDVANSANITALAKAIDSVNYEKAELLLEHGASPFIGRHNPLRVLTDNHDRWEPGTPNDLARKRLMASLRKMGLTESTAMKPALTRAALRIVSKGTSR